MSQPQALDAFTPISSILANTRDYDRRAVKPPSWDTFKNHTQFTGLRGFNVQDARITGYQEELEKFTRAHELGDVVWPSYPILFATNLEAVAEEIKRRDLYLFDVWGYLPGSGPAACHHALVQKECRIAENPRVRFLIGVGSVSNLRLQFTGFD